ncbi:radical SAM family heme chaperone HemW [Flavobacteriaceae bacterium TK19130]|nr:radical SAM family heme chaperone HemW [Thermobacterium salinum]
MAGIYLHIPFCKQACHYCDFHFSTSVKKKGEMVKAICSEIVLRKNELQGTVQTIYFGGGTPSLLSSEELAIIFETIFTTFEVSDTAEITLEANPDDLSEEVLQQLHDSPINRLSIGVQSFFEEDLTLMNRAHNAEEAWKSLQLAKQYFSNISIDLIYGIPGMSTERWLQNIEKALSLEIPHLSCYALTVEPRTALAHFIKKGIVPPVEDDIAQEHHTILVSKTEVAGYRNYEFSNFGKPGFHSQNNTAYWEGKPYLGIGPSAHSFDGNTRSWNVANNSKYISAIREETVPIERETLSTLDKYNEYIMTRLRTEKGIAIHEIREVFGELYAEYAKEQAKEHLQKGLLVEKENRIVVTKKGKFLSDGIASDLFKIL